MATLFVILSILISAVLPFAAIFALKRRFGINLKTIWSGALIWLVFTQVLEKALHAIVLTQTQISQYPVLFSVYAGLSAGVFEETGRFFAFRKFLKNYRDWKDGLGYGLGHGGIESVLVGVVGGIQTLLLIQLYKDGNLNSIPNLDPEIYTQIIASLNASPVIFLVSGIERVMALIIQIALSLLVLYSIKIKSPKFFVLAVLVHALVDFIPGLFQLKLINLLTAEFLIFGASLIGYLFIKKSKILFQSNR